MYYPTSPKQSDLSQTATQHARHSPNVLADCIKRNKEEEEEEGKKQ